MDAVPLTGVVAPELERLTELKNLRKVVLAQATVLADVPAATPADSLAAYQALNAYAQHQANHANTDANGYKG